MDQKEKNINLDERKSPQEKGCEMTGKNDYPENVRQFVDLVTAVLRRINEKQQNKPNIPYLNMAQ